MATGRKDLLWRSGVHLGTLSLRLKVLWYDTSVDYVPQKYIAVSFSKCPLCKSLRIKAYAKRPVHVNVGRRTPKPTRSTEIILPCSSVRWRWLMHSVASSAEDMLTKP